tara:strand:- start:1400 stop:1621 length:222 start_codon:yes stop_codon:yes gene_type:complete
MATIEGMQGGMVRIGINPILALFLSTLVLLILLNLGQYLWNNVLIKVCTIVKPVNSIWQILGLYVLLQILLGK